MLLSVKNRLTGSPLGPTTGMMSVPVIVPESFLSRNTLATAESAAATVPVSFAGLSIVPKTTILDASTAEMIPVSVVGARLYTTLLSVAEIVPESVRVMVLNTNDVSDAENVPESVRLPAPNTLLVSVPDMVPESNKSLASWL